MLLIVYRGKCNKTDLMVLSVLSVLCCCCCCCMCVFRSSVHGSTHRVATANCKAYGELIVKRVNVMMLYGLPEYDCARYTRVRVVLLCCAIRARASRIRLYTHITHSTARSTMCIKSGSQHTRSAGIHFIIVSNWMYRARVQHTLSHIVYTAIQKRWGISNKQASKHPTQPHAHETMCAAAIVDQPNTSNCTLNHEVNVTRRNCVFVCVCVCCVVCVQYDIFVRECRRHTAAAEEKENLCVLKRRMTKNRVLQGTTHTIRTTM